MGGRGWSATHGNEILFNIFGFQEKKKSFLGKSCLKLGIFGNLIPFQ
jgi:hypothetical protein